MSMDDMPCSPPSPSGFLPSVSWFHSNHGAVYSSFHPSGREERIQKFFNNILTVNLVSGAVVGSLYFLVTSLFLPDLNLFLFIAMGATIFVRATTHSFFTLFLGLNQAALWGMGEIFRHG